MNSLIILNIENKITRQILFDEIIDDLLSEKHDVRHYKFGYIRVTICKKKKYRTYIYIYIYLLIFNCEKTQFLITLYNIKFMYFTFL
jgi:hypothetical protein